MTFARSQVVTEVPNLAGKEGSGIAGKVVSFFFVLAERHLSDLKKKMYSINFLTWYNVNFFRIFFLNV